MTAIQGHELSPGLCAFLDFATMAQRADALRSPYVDHLGLTTKAIRLPFLVLEYVPKRSACLCVPLFDHEEEEGQEALNDDLKEKGGIGWQVRPSFVTPRDGWMIPVPTLKLASECDVNTVQNRMWYARRNPKELYRIRKFCISSDAEFVPIWDRPTVLAKPKFERTGPRPSFDMSRGWAAPHNVIR
jgi:hypothetical protein